MLFRREGDPLRGLRQRLTSLERQRLRELGRTLTLVVEARPGIHPAITAGGRTVGVRITSSQVAAALAVAAGGALVATSANRSGQPPPRSAEALDPALRARLDYVLDAGQSPGGRPSTVVAVEGERLVLLREGPVPFEAVQRAATPGGAT
jgi:L-threonylcarbamoyladenylate synthase